MKTVTLDILNDKALALLKDLELLKIIHVHREKPDLKPEINLVSKYKGAMTPQSLSAIDEQLKELRN